MLKSILITESEQDSFTKALAKAVNKLETGAAKTELTRLLSRMQKARCVTDSPFSAMERQVSKAIEFHQSNSNDPYNIGNAVIASLSEVRIALQEAQK